MNEALPIIRYPLALAQEQIEKLKQPTPTQFIEKRPGPGGKLLSYVETGFIIAQLNEVFGHVWNFEIIREDIRGTHVWVLGRLKVLLSDGIVITKDQYGSAEVKTQKVKTCPACRTDNNYMQQQCRNRDCGHSLVDEPVTEKPLALGDDFKAAASDAMKKCASLLGIATDVYHPRVDQKKKSRLSARAGEKRLAVAEVKEAFARCKTTEELIAERQKALAFPWSKEDAAAIRECLQEIRRKLNEPSNGKDDRAGMNAA